MQIKLEQNTPTFLEMTLLKIMLWGVQNKIQAREQLCIIFQVINNVIQQESSEGENFRKFQGFVAIHENLLCEIGGCRVFGGDTSE